MSDDPSIKTPPFQFTLRTLVLITTFTAVALALCMWKGIGAIPLVLGGFGVSVGSVSLRRGEGVPLAVRVAWIVFCGSVGGLTGLALSEMLGARPSGWSFASALGAMVIIGALAISLRVLARRH